MVSWPLFVELDKPTTPGEEVPCTDDYWTEWFNVSHPDVDGGDFETLDRIRQAGQEVCEQKYIKDIECQFYHTSSEPS